jgi:hypothetical protein
MEETVIESFTATVVSTHEDGEFLVVGLGQASSDGYLMFQRSLPIGSEDDFGVYIEFDDEASSAYDAVTVCGLSRRRLVVELGEPIGPAGTINGFDIELAADDRHFSALADGLRKVFSDTEDILQIEDR